jgi:hypothetical protein
MFSYKVLYRIISTNRHTDTNETFRTERDEKNVPTEVSQCGGCLYDVLRHIKGSLICDALGEDGGLDGIPGLVPGLVPGIQGCKSPGSLGQTWDRAKSLNFILIDSIFLLSPCPETHCHARCFPVFFKDFSEGKNIYFETPSPGLPRGKADGGCNRVPLACPKL